MTQRIEFIIPGPIASDHRPHTAQFDGKGRRLSRPMTYPNKDYEAFRVRARMAARQALAKGTWQIPSKNTELRMFLEHHVASHKKIFIKTTKRIVTRQRTCPDYGNMNKCVEDSLQKPSKKHNPYNLPAKDIGYLYIDDHKLEAYPFPGRKWITIEPGFDEWIVVALEVVGEFQPHVEQSNLIFEDKF